MLESDSPKKISLQEGTQWDENHKNKTRAGNIPTPPQRRRGWEWRAEFRKSSYRIAWSIFRLQAPHTSCLWCHLLQPSAGCFLWVAFPEAACSSCRTRSGHPSTLPATVSPLHPVFLTGPPAPKMTLHLSGGPFFIGYLLCKWGLQSTLTTTGPGKSQPSGHSTVELCFTPNCLPAQLWTVPGPTGI